MSLIFGDGADSGSGNTSAACEMCGWLAALGGMLAFGSFGVPIKSKVAKSLNIDPLVMQSYKTTMCFLTSWLFVLLRGEKYTFTPWGIVSGLFWVPGGVATIYAIKTAGLAIGIGVGSSFIVLVSFGWGIFVFGEHVHNHVQACIAVGCMLLGLCGMAYFSSPKVAHASHQQQQQEASAGESHVNIGGAYYHSLRPEDPDFLRPDEDEDNDVAGPLTDYVAMEEMTSNTAAADNDNNQNDDQAQDTAAEEENLVIEVEDIGSTSINIDEEEDNDEDNSNSPSSVLCCFGTIRVQERTLGILAALMFTGIWGGSILVPMHYAPPLDKGLPFLISFAVGAAVVNLSMWAFRYLYLCMRYSSMKLAYQALPSFHLRKMWLYGGTCGLLWSIGNFFSILAVEYLGEGVGYSATQASMLVSGLWGIFYFHEIEGMDAITKWYASAMVTALGILLLSYEHHEK